MQMKQSDYQRLFMKHKMMYRDYDNATPELLAYWAFHDKRDQQILEQLLIEEAKEEALTEASLDGFNVKFTSEVKIK